MKISDKQVLILFEIAKDSLKLFSADDLFTFDNKTRKALVNQIVNHQDDTIIDLGKKEKKLQKQDGFQIPDDECFRTPTNKEWKDMQNFELVLEGDKNNNEIHS